MLDKIRAAGAKASQAVVNTIGPQAPDAKIDPTMAQVLQAALQKTVSTLTDGEVELPDMPQEATGKLGPEAFTALMAFEGMIEGLVKSGVEEARAYKIDAKVAASDPERLLEASQTIMAAGKDRALAVAMKKASPLPPEPEAKPAPTVEPPPALSMGEELAGLQPAEGA
jgi:hypothetical protein